LSFYEKILAPLFFCLEPEDAHWLGIAALKSGLLLNSQADEDTILNIEVWEKKFSNPVGLAAGFDKNAEAPDAIIRQGFGFAEVGTVTPLAQPGNSKPRLFRLNEDKAIINRLGFNNHGLKPFRAKLEKRRRVGASGIVGANMGKNKNSDDAILDYVTLIEALVNVADYLVMNISSPNTPGLRDLQGRDQLEELIAAALKARNDNAKQNCPLLLKVAPDLSDQDVKDISDVAIQFKIDGIIATNTTLDRPEYLQSEYRQESGGLSGRPVYEPSTHILGEFYKCTEGKIPLIGVGGISSGFDAYEKIKSGASLVQLYTAMIYRGPGIAVKIRNELAECLRKDRYTSVGNAVGANFH